MKILDTFPPLSALLCGASLLLPWEPLWSQPASVENAPADVEEVNPERADELFSFKAVDLDLKQALALFAEANDLNIIPDRDIEGSITLSFKDLPLDLAMHALLDAHGYYFVKTGRLIRVRNLQTRIFHINYINTVRTGSGANDIQFSSRGGENGAGGSSMVVSADNTIDFWKTISEQLAAMVTLEGSYSVNSLAGIITVTDRYSKMLEIASYLDFVSENVVRQVELEVEIYEVALSENTRLGIDWTRVSDSLHSTITGDLIVSSASNGSGFTPSTLNINFAHGNTNALLEALQEQGELSVLSKPRLRTLNNQPSVIRVGQEIPVFRQTVTTAPGDPPLVSIEEEIENITIGTVLSITPQISRDGMVTLDVSPAISRLLRNEISAVTGASAPVIDVRQSSSIVRIKEGTTVVLGGLVQTEINNTVRKVPLVSKIPVIGEVFKGRRSVKSTSELVVVLTPRLAH